MSMISHEPSTAEQIMKAAASLFLSGQYVSVEKIAQASGKSRATIHTIFGREMEGVPAVKAIEDRIIAHVLDQTRATMFMFLAAQGPLAAGNPVQQLITVFRAAVSVFNSNILGRFVAYRLNDPEENETLSSIFSQVDEMFAAAHRAGKLEAHAELDLRKLRLMLFGVLRGFLTLLPTGEQGPAKKSSARPRTVRDSKRVAEIQQEPLTAKDIELEFLRIFQLHVSGESKKLVGEHIEAVLKS